MEGADLKRLFIENLNYDQALSYILLISHPSNTVQQHSLFFLS